MKKKMVIRLNCGHFEKKIDVSDCFSKSLSQPNPWCPTHPTLLSLPTPLIFPLPIMWYLAMHALGEEARDVCDLGCLAFLQSHLEDAGGGALMVIQTF